MMLRCLVIACGLSVAGCGQTVVSQFSTSDGQGHVIAYAGNGLTVPMTVMVIPTQGGQQVVSAGGQTPISAALNGAVAGAAIGAGIAAFPPVRSNTKFIQNVGF
jgi:hypothetical protein